ncbi:hypothetical protein TTHERM_01123960 (macronuclear) [Tetrahymena thermophila SB210]|uniref:Uncharacterized protein n=1 Tax=Tetrahymena thermophila (strain SB210) TaxID=312017 RepID=Q22B42_TETTS|nr:hypothetical protein TTHERM_01123960 [Tetrahymena thermophila SB210]EAR82513.2 hypothetical protein TTHERM_01123960 [Tetrahymena thermophila SB210]|eukprot:XP_001030176.2 hypothetical protein TTHERM_01123960 [Tetrahymena thermophila SB210]
MGSTQSAQDADANPREIRRRASRTERNKSFSHQADRNKTLITDSILKDILTSIKKLINDQPISLNYIIQDIESKLNEESIRSILVSLLMKQGLKQFQSDPSLDTNSQNESIVQDVIQQTMVDLFLMPFFASFESKSSNIRSLDSQEAKQLLLDQLKNDVQNFKNFCYEFFAIIIKKINLKINKELIKQIIQDTIFRPSSIDDDIKAQQRAKQFIHQYYQSYELYYSYQEQQLENYIPILELAETQKLESFKQTLVQNKLFSECLKKMKKIFQKPQSSNFMAITEQIYSIAQKFNNSIYQIDKNIFGDGADSRQILNINFISMFNTPGFYTSCIFIQDNYENLIQPLHRHLITTLCISFEHILYYIREQADNNQMNMQTQASLGEINQCQSIYNAKQFTIS